jgi:hypothetical protein
MKRWYRKWLSFQGCVMLLATGALAETCVTQSQMSPLERDSIANAAQALATKVQSNDLMGLQMATIPEFVANFSGIENAASAAAPKLTGDTAQIEQVYVLDATGNKINPDGSAANAEFVCILNKGSAEADFSINALPPGRYGFAMVQFVGPSPWLLSMLLRQDGNGTPWKLAGLFPKGTTAAGHDGLWYWSQGRAMSASKQIWTAYIYYQQAQRLLQPAGFVSSTHLENLRVEASGAAPKEFGNGISAEAPYVVKGQDGKEYRFASISPDDSLHKDKLDIAVHMMSDSEGSDTFAVHKRNLDAMSAMLAQHPELRQSFHGMWVFSETPGQVPIANEAAMSDIH